VNSHLLEGRVRHRRSRPFIHELEHAVYYAALDLAEIGEVDRRLRLFARNRLNAFTFRDADHLPEPARDLPSAIEATLRDHGHESTGWRIVLVTNLRVLGHVFNPASFYLCRDGEGRLRVVIVEVHNTHGERHLYVLEADASSGRESPSGPPADDPERPFRAAMAKAFYVSPFIAMEGRYTVHVRDAGRRLTIAINEYDGDQPLLTTSLVLDRRPLTDLALLRMLVRHPFVTQRTIGLIHLHALRLWLKGARFHRHAAAVRSAPTASAAGGSGGRVGISEASR